MPFPLNQRLVSPTHELGQPEPPAKDYEGFKAQWTRFQEHIRRDLDSIRGGVRGGSVYPRLITWVDGDTTPSVGVPEPTITFAFTEAYTGAANVTTFDDGADGQIVTVHFTSGNITLKDGATLQLSDGGADFVGYSGWVLTFQRISGVWKEIARSET